MTSTVAPPRCTVRTCTWKPTAAGAQPWTEDTRNQALADHLTSEHDQPVTPFLAGILASSDRLANDLSLEGGDLIEARALDAAREVGRPLGLGDDVIDAVAAPLVRWLRADEQTRQYLKGIYEHAAGQVTAMRKLHRQMRATDFDKARCFHCQEPWPCTEAQIAYSLPAPAGASES
jgi:hypothetical protein